MNLLGCFLNEDFLIWNILEIKFLSFLSLNLFIIQRTKSSILFQKSFLLFWKFRRRKSTWIAVEFIFLVSQKFVICKILNSLKPVWFTIDSSVLLNEGVRFFFHDICHLFGCIADCKNNIKGGYKRFPKY